MQSTVDITGGRPNHPPPYTNGSVRKRSLEYNPMYSDTMLNVVKKKSLDLGLCLHRVCGCNPMHAFMRASPLELYTEYRCIDVSLLFKFLLSLMNLCTTLYGRSPELCHVMNGWRVGQG